MTREAQRRSNIKIITAAVSVFAIIMTVLICYSQVMTKQIIEQTKYVVTHNTKSVSDEIDASIGYALNSIQVTASAISDSMQNEILENPAEEIRKYIANTPFDSIEYIQPDGMNMTDAGTPFDASEREYYIRGIRGETGIWINYTPKYADEPLLNFYTPLYYKGGIAGVLTGTVGGNSSVASMMISEYQNQMVAGMLLDKDNRIIASTIAFQAGTVLNWDTAQVRNMNKNTLLDAIEHANGETFILIGKGGNSVGCVSLVERTGWKIIQIVPDVSMVKITKSTKEIAYASVGIVMVSCIFLFSVILLENKKQSNASIKKANSERDEQFALLTSMAEIYHSMHLINLEKNTVKEYSSSKEIREYVHTGPDAVSMMKKVMQATVTAEYLEKVLQFTDLTTIGKRMRNKKSVSMDFIGKSTGWIRAVFIMLDKNEQGYPTKIIFATQGIDEEKKKEENLIQQSNTDEMTGFCNRRAYEDDVANYPDYPPEEDYTYISFDVNGLKVVNDTLGHAAGDELLKGAADVMQRCFGNYGRLYRTGGDEFVAMIFANEERLEQIKQDFAEQVASWRGATVEALAISAGYVTKREFPHTTVSEMAKIADKRMYDAKARYYKNSGVDRRGQAAANTALCETYTKILKVNLTEDSYRIVRMEENEKSIEKGFSTKISEWLRNFGESDQVLEKDREEYQKKTDINYLKEYFKGGKKSIIIFYHRKIGNEYKQVMMEIIPADDYTSEKQSLFLYVKSIE